MYHRIINNPIPKENLADYINDFFANVAPRLASQFPDWPSEPSSVPNILIAQWQEHGTFQV